MAKKFFGIILKIIDVLAVVLVVFGGGILVPELLWKMAMAAFHIFMGEITALQYLPTKDIVFAVEIVICILWCIVRWKKIFKW
jgi:hypothetical protein